MTDRQFILDRPERLPNFTAWLNKQSLPLDVRVCPYEQKRSSAANRRLWKLHGMAAAVTGYSADDMHEFALMRHFGHVDQKIGNATRRVPAKRSSQRNKREFGEFMEATEAFYATELGVWLEHDGGL